MLNTLQAIPMLVFYKSSMDVLPYVVQGLRGFFILATVSALFVNALPAFRERFLVYGARQSRTAAQATQKNEIANDVSSVTKLLNAGAAVQVPHSWFIHFYVVSVLSSGWWLYQITTNGSVFQRVAMSAVPDLSASLSIGQVWLGWTLMAVQGTRRLYECAFISKSSRSRMSFVNWLLGITFYIAVGMSVWIEGSRMSPVTISKQECAR
jgi:3-oxo-5-alpha-steroid 4-dehydrogenase 3